MIEIHEAHEGLNLGDILWGQPIPDPGNAAILTGSISMQPSERIRPRYSTMVHSNVHFSALR